MKINENGLIAIIATMVCIILTTLIIFKSDELPEFRKIDVKGEIVDITFDDINKKTIIDIKITDVLDDTLFIDFYINTTQSITLYDKYDYMRGDIITTTLKTPIKYDYNKFIIKK